MVRFYFIVLKCNCLSPIPKILSKFQAINMAVSSELIERVGGIQSGHRLTSDLLCDVCVKNRCRQIKLTNEIAEDAKLVQDLLKENVDER